MVVRGLRHRRPRGPATDWNMRITSYLRAIPLLSALLPALAYGPVDDLNRSLHRLQFDTNIAGAEVYCSKLLMDYTNSPEITGRIYLSLALNNAFLAQRQTEGIAKTIENSQRALQFPLGVLDECRAYERLGGGFQMKIAMGLSLKDETLVRKQALGAYLNGLKAVLSKAKTLEKQELPFVDILSVYTSVDMFSESSGGEDDSTYKAVLQDHEAKVKAYDDAKAANALVDRYEWFKTDVVGLYRGVPYVEEIAEVGEKIMPGAPILKELVEAAKKANAPPPATNSLVNPER